VHHGGGSSEIHLLGRRSEDNLDTFGFEAGTVGFQGAGILTEILGGAELQWITNIDTTTRSAALRGAAHQREVALMQCTHGGNEADGRS